MKRSEMKRKVKRINTDGETVVDKRAKVKGDCSKYRTITLESPKVVDDPKLQIIMYENGTIDHMFHANHTKDSYKKTKRKRYL